MSISSIWKSFTGIFFKSLPEITNTAVVVETLTGNADLVPLTKSVSQSVASFESHQALANHVSDLASIVSTIAQSSGDKKVADYASKIKDSVKLLSGT